MARDGRSVFASVSQSRSCRSRSARSRKRRCLKNEPLTQPTRFSTLPFSCGRYGQHTSTPKPEIQRHAGKERIPLRDHAIAAPPQRHRLRPIKDGQQGNAAERGEVIDQRPHQRLDRSSGTSVTSTHREYFSRDAKKCIWQSNHEARMSVVTQTVARGHSLNSLRTMIEPAGPWHHRLGGAYQRYHHRADQALVRDFTKALDWLIINVVKSSPPRHKKKYSPGSDAGPRGLRTRTPMVACERDDMGGSGVRRQTVPVDGARRAAERWLSTPWWPESKDQAPGW